MQEPSTSTAIPTNAIKTEALASMSASFERFCLAAGLEALAEMMEQDALAACGERHERGRRRKAHRWGKTKGKIGFHGGKVEMARPRLRGFDGKEQALPSWEAAQSEDWLGKWAMNQMLINVSTRKLHCSRTINLDNRGVQLVVCPDRLDAHSSGRYPTNCDVHCRNSQWPLYVGSGRLLRVNTGRSPTAHRMGQIDPLLSFRISPISAENDRKRA